MTKKFVQLTFGSVLLLLTALCLADDTDVYLNVGAGLPVGSEPMVIFSLDYRPNLGSTVCNGSECDTLIAEGYLPAIGPFTFFDVLRAALKKVMDPPEGVRIGLMLNHDNRNNCEGPGQTNCSNGGYIAMGFAPFVAGDTNGAKARFHSILANMPVPGGGQSHSYQGKELYYELFHYLSGQGVYNGHNGWTDYGTNSNDNLDVDGTAYAWDTGIESGLDYVSPMNAAMQCVNLYAVNMMFFVANQDDDSDDAIDAPIAGGGFGSSQADFEDVIRYLNDADLADGNYGTAPNIGGTQNLTSYFVVDETKINNTTNGYAQAGGTGQPLVLSENPDELVRTLQEIFNQVLSVSTTFVAASVPVNVFNRAEIVDNVFLALFQVNGDSKPAWVGNIKKLRLQLDADGGLLVDALGNAAIAADGRIRFDALTYWTDPSDLPAPDLDAGEVAGRDGRFVSRGGAAQQVPGFVTGDPGLANGFGTRQLFYDRSANSLAALNVDLATATELQADLGAASTAEAAELIAYAREMDVDDLDADGNVDEARPWIFGDPLHSRPLPLNYGARDGYSADNPAIFLAVASNDGFLHFIRNTEVGGAESGEEIWAFMPRETMANQRTLRANATGAPHPYTLDGSPVAYIEDSNFNGSIEPGEKAYLFVGLRRAGKAYYALDISDPENPRLMWTIEKGGAFGELANTFSNPRVGLVNVNGTPRPAIIFAGGYDFNKDARGGVGTNDTEGNAIYVVDAETGSLIWKARQGTGFPTNTVFEHPDLVDSIPSTVAIADTDGDLLIDRILVGDTGGNVWRADIGGPDSINWTLTLLASLGRHAPGSAGKSDDRRFFHRPDIVPTQDKDGVYDAVLIGSGDRPDPLDQGGVASNYFYMIKDRNVMPGSGTDTGIDHDSLGDVTDNCLQEGGACMIDLNPGWRLELEETGEKALATPVTISGSVFFTTYLPSGASSASACAPSEGQGRLYAVSLHDASSVINYDTSTDEPGGPDEGTTTSDRFTDLHSPGIPAEIVSVPPNRILRPDLQVDTLDITTRWRTFWYLEEDSDL
jgi:type IV pilus assembly protein PilY1